MTRQPQPILNSRRFSDALRERFGIKADVTRDAFARLGRIWNENDEAFQRAFLQWRASWRAASSPVVTPAVLKALEPWQAALTPETVVALKRLDDDQRGDALFFLMQTLIAQTILAVVQTDFSLDEATLERLFSTFPFDWGRQARDAMNVTCDDLKTLRIHDVATRFDPFGEIYSRFFSSSLRRTLGEFYTPQALAEFLYARASRFWREKRMDSDAIPTILDPTCGAGVFLTSAIRAMLNSGVSPDRALDSVHGFDLSPLAALATRANLLYAALSREPSETPTLRRDSLERLILARRARERRAPILPAEILDAVTLRDPFALRDDAPSERRRFDVALGNPPWIVWDRLSEEYRRATLPYWQEFGLFTLSGRQARYGGGKKELAGLIVAVCVSRLLREGSVFSFVLPRALFQTSTAGAGFRKFGVGDFWEFSALELDDLSELSLFSYVGSKATALTGRVGSPTQYPITARRWLPDAKTVDASNDAEFVAASVALDASFVEGTAAPQKNDDLGSPLSLRFPNVAQSASRHVEPLRKRVDELVAQLFEETRRTPAASRYSAKLGANAAGACGVFWFDGKVSLDAETATVRNLGDSGRRKLPTLETRLETALLFPLLRWRDVDEYYFREPETLMLIPQDPESRRGYDLETMRVRYPLTLEYLTRHEAVLRSRAAYRRYQSRAPFWSLYNVDASTFATFKVVWRRMDDVLRATVVAHDAKRDRPIVPQETLSSVAVATLDEADYLAATLNSEPARAIVAERVAPGSRSFGTPGTLDAIPATRYNPASALCQELAELGRRLRLNARKSRETPR